MLILLFCCSITTIANIGQAIKGLSLFSHTNSQSGMYQEEVGREGIEPSWVAPGDFKSPASTISPPPQAAIGSLCA
jgi:hypothetical protein